MSARVIHYIYLVCVPLTSLGAQSRCDCFQRWQGGLAAPVQCSVHETGQQHGLSAT